MEHVAHLLVDWYQQNKRDLPWRHTKDPYLIWLSEIILQQTRVDQGLRYYMAFADQYPTVYDLANAPEDEVLRLWQGLGYYSRARNLHKTAQIIVTNHQGKFPTTSHALQKLKGIGPYTAAAIASFAFDEDIPVVDGNVFRVLSRLYADPTDISSSAARKHFTQLAMPLLPKGDAAIFNQTIMEFGALQCTPKNPSCLTCPVADHCAAFAQKNVANYPVKLKKQAVRHRYFYYFVVETQKGDIMMEQRQNKDIWQGLYQFPLVEKENHTPAEEVIEEVDPKQDAPSTRIKGVSKTYIHQLSHQRLHAVFIRLSESVYKRLHTDNQRTYTITEIQELPKPVLINNYLKDEFF